MGGRKRKAPSGCYWRAKTLWGRYRPVGATPIQFSLCTDDPRVAKERYTAEKARIIAGLRFGDAKRTFDDVLREWANHVKSAVESGTLSPKTARRYTTSLAQLQVALEGRPLSDITTKLIADIVAKRKQDGVKHGTIKRDLHALSSVMNFAVGNEWCDENTVLVFLERNKKTKLVREQRPKIVLPRQKDIDFVKARSPAVFGFLIDGAIRTGAREDELVKLALDNIDHAKKSLTILGSESGGGAKRDKTRTIRLDIMGGFEFFSSLPSFIGCANVFWHHAGDQYVNFASHFHRKVKSLARQAAKEGVDFRRFTFHSLRHLHAIEFLRRQCGTLHELKDRLGHSTIKTTEEYLESGLLTDEEKRWALYGRPAPVATKVATIDQNASFY
jgi:integrase/recombinase XerD